MQTTPGNTLNQGLDIYYQLRAASRWFDLRVGDTYNSRNKDRYKFGLLHLGDETGGSKLGNAGESFDEVIEEINRFSKTQVSAKNCKVDQVQESVRISKENNIKFCTKYIIW